MCRPLMFVLYLNRKLQSWRRLKDNAITNTSSLTTVENVYNFPLNKFGKFAKLTIFIDLRHMMDFYKLWREEIGVQYCLDNRKKNENRIKN